MGNTTSCTNLHEYKNACNFSMCVTDVFGIKASSASPTDQWLLTLPPNTKYNDKDINQAFMKFFTNPVSVGFVMSPDDISKLDGLTYEIRLYKDVIRPLIEYNICPNFVKYLGSSEGCTSDQMKRFLQKALVSKTTTLLTADVIDDVFERNVTYMLNGIPNRPSINDPTGLHVPEYNIDIKYKNMYLYNILINESMGKNLQYHDWISERHPTRQTEYTLSDWKVLFQFIAACYAMSLSKMSHNDLHTGNAYVVKVPDEEVAYVLNGKVYRFKVAYKVKVFDFDRGYSPRFGENSINNDYMCSTYNMCNNLIPNRDIIKFFTYVYEFTLNATNKENILDIITDDPSQRLYVKQILDNPKTSHALRKPEDLGVITEPEFTQGFATLDSMIVKCGRVIHASGDVPATFDMNSIFTCNPDMFDSNGIVKKPSAAEALIGKGSGKTLMNTIAKKDAEIKTIKDDLEEYKRTQNVEIRTLQIKLKDCQSIMETHDL